MPPDSSPPTLESLLHGVGAVPSLPLFHERLDEAINHPRSSITDISKIISEDQGLTARILKLANSPFYGYFSKIDTISQAVTIIGVQQVRDLALAVSVMGLFKGIPEDLITMELFWKHSIGCGLTARALATTLREANLERFFVGGILHDIGRLVMFITIPELCREMIETCRNEGRLLYEVERERLGFDHGAVGGMLLRNWKIPFRISEPAEFHHYCQRACQYPRETAILHVADLIAHALEFGNSGELLVPSLDTAAWNGLALSHNQLPMIIKQVDIQFADTIAVLQGDAGE
ncbi:HDOD domain-containing protein [Geobacter sp. SVR]|uniref:HDOD domain-containing protein n=1 Tax=Geobacter sp. SVR TaxID=2495594 RepID=UPI00143EFB48|nr:HDOD domain-containing protein [Geobacter sp. SVR]BCS54856.1 HD family phosphohydrolase [Geobacter sp. SVR]GCF86336.1 HD family phosphohydrolase [Geobacter sp. SVR]